ncbi:tRNA-specific adenosine deaminase subunit tad3 [Linderina pennispora]|nr:tRNA-specific adenosine deaminase subunit tad3 [Linderina pennispora]
MNSTSFEITRIPTPDEQRALTTETVYTTTISPQKTSQLLSFIAKHLPKLTGIEHVKRVRKTSTFLQVILCQTSAITEEELLRILKDSEWTLGEICQVPDTPPITADQFSKWKDVWPVAFRPPAQNRVEITEEERKYIAGQILRSEQEGVVMCQPKTHAVVASATAQDHPLRHAAMCCIGKVADLELARKDSLVPAKRMHDEPSDTAGYLCEGLDVFAITEPCVM